MNCRPIACAIAAIPLFVLTSPLARSAATPAIGDWDGVASSAHLDGPYEDPVKANVPFGIISYYNHPWRSYMDTWPASRYSDLPGGNFNVNLKYADAVAQVMEESGMKSARIEVGWGNMGWNDDLRADTKANLVSLLGILKRHQIRPLMLLNAHHGLPCPEKDVRVELAIAADKGARTVQLKDPAASLRLGYTGFSSQGDYVACFPVLTSLDPDRTAHLSAPLRTAIKAGPITLQELKYQPFQGLKRKDGAPTSAAETFDGWLKYAAAIGRTVRDALGTEGQPDAGFDIEVWNEQTFGSNFLDINNYYSPKLEFTSPFVYQKTRERLPTFRPDARTAFKQEGAYAILPMTIDYFNDRANGFPGVRVISGFANQWPWDNGRDLWDGQAGFSRHFYTGGMIDCSPEKPLGKTNSGTIDALGNFDGKKDNKDWHTIVPGTNFVPTFRMAFPEYWHSGFKTETISRDVNPDSRLAYFSGHGRYTHNGDFHPAEVWQTEVNWDRSPFIAEAAKAAGVSQNDPRVETLNQYTAGKMMLRQFIFHAHKGLYRITMFCLGADSALGMLPKAFYSALDVSGGKLTEDVRKTLPPGYAGMAWLKKLFDTGEALAAPRPLKIADLVEYKPRLVFAGDGTPAHPNVWNRDWFAFLPFQLSANRFAIPYYVVTIDVTHSWDKSRDPLDPKRYDMPEQEFDVTIDNIAGRGAAVSDYDPLSGTAVPVKVVAATGTTLTLRLRTVDYPRVLQITETRPGPQILDPRVELSASGHIKVSWRTNIPASASLTYGNDWMNRSAILEQLGTAQPETKKPTGETHQEIAPGFKGVAAVRIKVNANGLTDVWPRWDEDPQGQIVIPGDSAGPASPSAATPAASSSLSSTLKIEPFSGFQRGGKESGAPHVLGSAPSMGPSDAGWEISLPPGLTLDGPPDDRRGILGAGDRSVRIRVRFVPGGSKDIDDLLPFAAIGDSVERHPVEWTGPANTLLVLCQLEPRAHPGVTNLRQRHLLIPVGKNGADMLLISASGSAAAMQDQNQAITRMFGSILIGR